jgi:predicted anti-sigma-YlaC factor YlaD
MRENECAHVGESIPQFLAGRLSADEEERVRTHIAGCADCRQRANAVSLLQQTPVPLPDPDRWDHFVDGVVDATEERQRSTVGRRAWTVAALLATAAVVVLSWVRLGGMGSGKPADIESIAREVAELPEAEAAAWTAGLNSSAFMSAGFDASELGAEELEQLVTEEGRS